MKHFINLKDIPASDLRKIISNAKKRKAKRKKLNTLEVDKDAPLERQATCSNVRNIKFKNKTKFLSCN